MEADTISAAFKAAAWRAIITMATQKLAGWAVYQLHARPSATVEMFLRWLARSGGFLLMSVKVGERDLTNKESAMMYVARLFVDHVADTVFNSSKPESILDFVKPLALPAPVAVQSQTVNEGVNQNLGTAVVNRFAKQIVINNPVRRMTKAKKELKMTPEERKQKKKEYMAQKRAEAKQAAGTIQ
jgi:hypothetical protein